jgi:1,2-phenylacetyl-CoA epoxidase PaaB subunit
MTMPHLENCPHQGKGWCCACVTRLWEEREALQTAVDNFVRQSSRARRVWVVRARDELRHIEGARS